MSKRAMVMCVFIVLLPNGIAQADDPPAEAGVIASFEGGYIDLSVGWGEAKACIADEAGARCYRSRRELAQAEAVDAPTTITGGVSTLATCASSLTLYSASWFGGTSLSLNTRGTPLNLSAYGFNNITSSYTIGGCDALFYDGASGSGLYPGSTSAWASATSMLANWDNRISTVYIG